MMRNTPKNIPIIKANSHSHITRHLHKDTKSVANQKHLKTLGLTTNATQEDIAKRFKQLVITEHPDHHPTNNALHNNNLTKIIEARDSLIGKQPLTSIKNSQTNLAQDFANTISKQKPSFGFDKKTTKAESSNPYTLNKNKKEQKNNQSHEVTLTDREILFMMRRYLATTKFTLANEQFKDYVGYYFITTQNHLTPKPTTQEIINQLQAIGIKATLVKTGENKHMESEHVRLDSTLVDIRDALAEALKNTPMAYSKEEAAELYAKISSDASYVFKISNLILVRSEDEQRYIIATQGSYIENSYGKRATLQTLINKAKELQIPDDWYRPIMLPTGPGLEFTVNINTLALMFGSSNLNYAHNNYLKGSLTAYINQYRKEVDPKGDNNHLEIYTTSGLRPNSEINSEANSKHDNSVDIYKRNDFTPMRR